jgi:hypothetical protein
MRGNPLFFNNERGRKIEKIASRNQKLQKMSLVEIKEECSGMVR